MRAQTSHPGNASWQVLTFGPASLIPYSFHPPIPGRHSYYPGRTHRNRTSQLLGTALSSGADRGHSVGPLIPNQPATISIPVPRACCIRLLPCSASMVSFSGNVLQRPSLLSTPVPVLPGPAPVALSTCMPSFQVTADERSAPPS